MAHFWLFVAYIVFGMCAHYGTHYVIKSVVGGGLNTLTKFWQLFILWGTVFAYILSIWIFCGWVIDTFGVNK